MKILVVDDDLISRMALIDVLNTMGHYTCLEAEDADTAWQILTTHCPAPALLCSDIRMPGLSGIDLLKRIREHPDLQDLPVMLISSSSNEETIKMAAAAGVTGYIVKPFSPDNARARLKKILHYVHSKMLEPPNTTLARLAITPERYRTYMRALQTQLNGHLKRLKESQAGMPALSVEQMSSLRTGCQTLGLWRASSMLNATQNNYDITLTQVEDILVEINQHVHIQLQSMN